MSQKIIKNPQEVPAIDNPNPKTTSTMANKTSKAIDKFSQQTKTAALILGGEAIAAQTNALLIPRLLKNESATTKQIVKAGVPLALGVILTMSVKNEYVRGLSFGFGTLGVLEAIKLIMPDFNPTEGFGDPSHFVYTDEDGNQQVVTTDQDGNQVTVPAGQLQSGDQSSAGQLGDWADSGYAEEGQDWELV
jgi:hypothetical protein